MGDLLTREEYEAIARNLVLPANAFIDGGFRPAKSGKTFETANPATGQKLADVKLRIRSLGRSGCSTSWVRWPT